MKKLVSFVILSGIFLSGFSQNPATDTQKGSGKISGIVMDGETNKPVEFANVALVDPQTGKPVDGTVCDDQGKFMLNKVVEGTYTISISFIGYETNTIAGITVDKKSDINLGTIKLMSSAKVLNEVVVQGQRQLIEEKVDRTVYNAENDRTTAGGDATDVLKRVPMLSVDMDGNVSMRGNQNITVLINNKPSTITAGSVADALKQIPADQIKTVEVITSPSAKYDAEGSAGIINIVTKKNTLQGATLNVDAGVGLRGSNLGLNGSYRNGKMGFNLGGFGRAGYNIKGTFDNDQYTNGQLNTQTADTRSNNLFGRYTLGWDYDINKNNYMSASVQYGVRNMNSNQNNLLRQTIDTSNGNILFEENRDTETIDESGNIDINLDFTHTYEKPQRELSFSTRYSRNNRNNNFLNTIYDTNSAIDSLIKNINNSTNQEITAQFDYQTPVSTNQMLEFGGKNIMRIVTSDYKYFGANGSNGDYIPVTGAAASNLFNYDQNVTAGYLSYTYTTKSALSVKAGARYEYTTIHADFANDLEDAEDLNTDIPSYGVLVPSVNLSKKLKNGNTVKLAYNRRIQRPSIQFLNPNINAANPLNITVGNPGLDPEYTNNYELGYSTFIKGTSLNFAAFMRNTTGSIQSVRTTKGDTIVTYYQNIGEENAYGLNFFANVNIGSKFSLNGGADVFYAVMDNNLQDQYAASNQGWVASGRLFGNYNLGSGWGLQFFGMYRGNRVQLQGSQGGFGYYSLGIKKEFNNKKGSIGFAAENFLTESIKIRNEVETPTISQKSVNEMYNMSFRINVSYRIGKMSFDGQRPRRKKSVNNDDMKDGGDGGMDMGGQQNGQSQQTRGTGMAMMAAPAATAKQAEKTVSTDTAKATVDATGVWEYTNETPQGTSTGKITIVKTDTGYSGTIFSSRTNQETALTSVSVSGNELTASYTANFGGNEVPVTIKGTIVVNDMDATMSFGQFRTVPIKAKRK